MFYLLVLLPIGLSKSGNKYFFNKLINYFIYMNNIFNKLNEFESRIKKLEQRIEKLEGKKNNNYMEPNNSLYML